MRMYWRRLCALVIVMLVMGMVGASTQAASTFASLAFQQQWQAGEAIVPNFWGPLSTAHDGQQEPYKQATGGLRLVQYFDKTRMELTNPVTDTVTNGLLTVEMKTGRLQIGDDTFEQRQPAKANVAGDPGSDGPTYADLAQLPEKQPDADIAAFPFIYTNGTFTRPKTERDFPFDIFHFPDGSLGHDDYVSDPGGRFGAVVFRPFRKFVPDFVALYGYPITPMFFAQTKIAGTQRTVLIQAFERRVLTYNPNNDPAFRVEFGNIGQHYYQWRYGTSASVPVAPVSTTPSIPTAVSTPVPVSTPAPVPATTPAIAPATSGVTFTSVQGAKPGNVATVMVQTAPSASCSIGYVTPKGTQSEAAGLVPKTADASGNVSWSWLIGGNTTPGTGRVTVTCNGMSATTNITIG